MRFVDIPCGGCGCVVEGGCRQWCSVGGRIGVRFRRCMEKLTVSNSALSRKRRRTTMIEGVSPFPMVVACERVHGGCWGRG